MKKLFIRANIIFLFFILFISSIQAAPDNNEDLRKKQFVDFMMSVLNDYPYIGYEYMVMMIPRRDLAAQIFKPTEKLPFCLEMSEEQLANDVKRYENTLIELSLSSKFKNTNFNYRSNPQQFQYYYQWKKEMPNLHIPRDIPNKNCIESNDTVFLLKYYGYLLNSCGSYHYLIRETFLGGRDEEFNKKQEKLRTMLVYETDPLILLSVKWKIYENAKKNDVAAMFFIVQEELFAIEESWDKNSDENWLKSVKKELVEFCRILSDMHNEPFGDYVIGKLFLFGYGFGDNRLLAIDHFYKSANRYIENNARDRALKVYELMNTAAPNNPLTKKIEYKLYYDGKDSEKANSRKIYGTGWICDKGYIITNQHVVNKCKNINAIINRKKYVLKPVVEDKGNDIAVLKIENPTTSLKGIRIANNLPKVAANVFTIGFPHPDIMGSTPKFTSGKINSLFGLNDDPRILQISVPLQAGNSGGPLINKRGEAVGIVTSKLNAKEIFNWTGDVPQNVNYAVKIQYVKSLIDIVPNNSKIDTIEIKEWSESDLYEELKNSVCMIIAE